MYNYQLYHHVQSNKVEKSYVISFIKTHQFENTAQIFVFFVKAKSAKFDRDAIRRLVSIILIVNGWLIEKWYESKAVYKIEKVLPALHKVGVKNKFSKRKDTSETSRKSDEWRLLKKKLTPATQMRNTRVKKAAASRQVRRLVMHKTYWFSKFTENSGLSAFT